MSPHSPSGEEPDPTAEFLDEVRAEPGPWRTERPPDAEPEQATYGQHERQSGRLRRAADIAGQAAPYIPLATYAGFVAAEALDDDPGQDAGFFDTGGFDSGN